MKNLYIVNTNYQLYLTLLKVNYDFCTSGMKADIALTDQLINPSPNEILINLKKFNQVNNIYIIKDITIKRKTGRKLKKLIMYKWKIFKYVSEEFEKVGLNPLDKEYKDIFVFSDYSAVSHYLMMHKIYLNFIEDGIDIYYTYRENWKLYITYLFGFPRKFGLSKYIKTVWVLKPDNLPEVLKDKSVHYKIEEYKLMIDVPFIHDLLEIYAPGEIGFMKNTIDNIKEKKIFLLLTQTHAEDGIISEEEKINAYRQIIKKYAKKDHTVIIKAHPREKTNYNEIFPEYLKLPKSIPMELISELFENIDTCVAINSTSLLNLKCNNKIMTEGEFIEQRWKEYMNWLNVVEK